MFLIAGLGNPGDKYELTRHNVGFMIIDEMIKNLTLQTNINKSNFIADVIKASSSLLVKPQTFMNNSGQSIVAIADYYQIPLENIIVIHDDLDLPFGTVKYKMGGGHGGHNGLKSLDAHVGKEYIRVRVGIGKPEDKNDVANYVLSNFSKEELKQLEDIMTHIIKAVDALKHLPIDDVKSKFTLK
jgi:PTH1 family peptidyl-tRNA hydrolase